MAMAAIAGFLANPAMAAAPLPAAVGAMIDAAAANPDQLKAIVEIARKTDPDAVAEIDVRVAALARAQAAARLSVQVNSESNPPSGLEKLDPISRVTLGYAFWTPASPASMPIASNHARPWQAR